MSRPYFNPYEEKIVRVMYRSGIALSSFQIAKLSGLSWVTVKKHLRHLERKAVVRRRKRGEELFLWELNYDMLK